MQQTWHRMTVALSRRRVHSFDDDDDGAEYRHIPTHAKSSTCDTMQHSHTLTHVRTVYNRAQRTISVPCDGFMVDAGNFCLVEAKQQYYGKLECIQAIFMGRAGWLAKNVGRTLCSNDFYGHKTRRNSKVTRRSLRCIESFLCERAAIVTA